MISPVTDLISNREERGDTVEQIQGILLTGTCFWDGYAKSNHFEISGAVGDSAVGVSLTPAPVSRDSSLGNLVATEAILEVVEDRELKLRHDIVVRLSSDFAPCSVDGIC